MWSRFLTQIYFLFDTEEKAIYSAELEKHKKEKQEWKRKAENLEDKASAMQVLISLSC